MWWLILACVTTFLIILSDIFFTFGTKWTNYNRSIFGWVVVFAGGNACLSTIVYATFHENESLESFPYWIRAILLGITYVGLVRTKFSGIARDDGSEIPIGLEVAYDKFKKLCFNSINKSIITVQYEEARKLAKRKTLPELTEQVKFAIEADKICSEEEKAERLSWLLKVISEPDPENDDSETRLVLAHYLNSGERMSRSRWLLPE